MKVVVTAVVVGLPGVVVGYTGTVGLEEVLSDMLEETDSLECG